MSHDRIDESLIWLNETVSTHEKCPACGNNKAKRFLLVKSPDKTGDFPLDICENCETIFYETADSVIGYVDGHSDELFWRHYAEIGAGIDFMLRTLCCVPHPKQANLLEVGCGLGFVVDYWSRMGKGKAIGLERAIPHRVRNWDFSKVWNLRESSESSSVL